MFRWSLMLDLFINTKIFDWSNQYFDKNQLNWKISIKINKFKIHWIVLETFWWNIKAQIKFTFFEGRFS